MGVGTRGRSWKKVCYFGAPKNHILIMSRRYPEGKLFVGRLAKRTRTRDLEDAFEKYGRLLRCELKFGYAFLDFEDKRDAEDAMHGENGREICGARVVIEWAKGGRRMMNRGDECYRCQRFGHRARDCPELYDSRRRGGRSRSRERRRRTRSRSRSPKRRRTSRSGSRDDSRDRSKSRDRSTSRNKSTSPQKDRKEQSKSRSRSRSRSRKDSGRQSRSRSKSAGRSKSRSRSPRSKSKSKSRSRSR